MTISIVYMLITQNSTYNSLKNKSMTSNLKKKTI